MPCEMKVSDDPHRQHGLKTRATIAPSRAAVALVIGVFILVFVLLTIARAADVVPSPSAHPQHWSFIPPQRPAVPQVQNKSWPRNAIDNFVLHRLEQEKL